MLPECQPFGHLPQGNVGVRSGAASNQLLGLAEQLGAHNQVTILHEFSGRVAWQENGKLICQSIASAISCEPVLAGQRWRATVVINSNNTEHWIRYRSNTPFREFGCHLPTLCFFGGVSSHCVHAVQAVLVAC